jgi:hypothetical protein
MSELKPAELVRRYFHALATADGDLAAELFESDGIIDDLRGGHHHGTAEIRDFINRRPPLTLDGFAKEREEDATFCVYGVIHYGSGDDAPTRWLFTIGDRGLKHLINSRLASLEERALATH